MCTILQCSALLALAFYGLTQAAAAQVEVRFERPEQFRDASLNGRGQERLD
ncbi:DUF3016 domain-containing protein [Pseudomonas capeferrum]|uniref:hypothetical protein n=1 Tax=Pseudomonas capeferrum TaxID=1495066 RepID=UPI0015E42D82|nr:hypothetical protein [Pseudomonas capeferrum]MBA1202651.1 DUF3016 domain-containing protein [Pseudomonas capeferrum]